MLVKADVPQHTESSFDKASIVRQERARSTVGSSVNATVKSVRASVVRLQTVRSGNLKERGGEEKKKNLIFILL